ncbi:MAG TPA: AAA family ATPase [Candidatus Sulfomarinibacteraceae bacterium]|nr:AAA family ATPase [Candidatus Sulfomarinibacteraceae bacterium]
MRTLGQPVAVAAARALLAAGMPHAVLLSGPSGVGKTTLALDIAAALLCGAEEPAARPCRSCRACRMVEHANHPDLHRLAPSGPGGSISIGGRGERGVRDLIADLALLPVEGGARVALIESADRMSEDGQSAFLKTLEEPPSRTTILLCADDEERLLPTIRSRCARIRLGPMGSRGVEAVLQSGVLADAPTAARLARITDGRPGRAIAYALAPEAAAIRAEIARTLLDLLGAGVTARLTGTRELALRAADLVRALDAGAARAARAEAAAGPGGTAPSRRTGGARKGTGVVAAPDPAALEAAGAVAADGDDAVAGWPAARVPAAERRRGALALVAIWRSVLRDVALLGHGAAASVRDLDLLDDLEAAAARLAPETAARVLGRLDLAGEQLEGNVSPELVLDVLALHWTTGEPSGARRAAGAVP